MGKHGVQKRQSSRNIVGIVFCRLRNAFANTGIRREVHDRLDIVLGKDLAQRGFIGAVNTEKRHASGDCFPVSEGEVVNNNAGLPGFVQSLEGMGANVAGPADDCDMVHDFVVASAQLRFVPVAWVKS